MKKNCNARRERPKMPCTKYTMEMASSSGEGSSPITRMPLSFHHGEGGAVSRLPFLLLLSAWPPFDGSVTPSMLAEVSSMVWGGA